MESLPNEILLHIMSLIEIKDLMEFRYVNRRWNEVSLKVLGSSLWPISLLTRMEVNCFLREFKNSKWINKLKLAVNSIPINVLQEFASDFKHSKLELSLFVAPGVTKFESNPLTEAVIALLSQLQCISFLDVSFPQKYSAIPSSSIVLVQFKPFPNLRKITWNNPNALMLSSILKQSQNLTLLEVKSWSNGEQFTMKNMSIILQHLPPLATLSTTIIILSSDNTELDYLRGLCSYPNKLSSIVFEASDDVFETIFLGLNDIINEWHTVLTKYLGTQSASLKHLELIRLLSFEIPRLEGLQTLKFDTEEVILLNPNSIPNLKKLELMYSASITSIFAHRIWPSVSTLKFTKFCDSGVEENEELFHEIVEAFPNLNMFVIPRSGFVYFIKYCVENPTPITELQVFADLYLRDAYDHRNDFQEMIFALTGITEAIPRFAGFAEPFPYSIPPGRAHSPGLSGVKRLQMCRCNMDILDVLVFASRCVNLKFNMLQITVLSKEEDPLEFKEYWETLSKYHAVVILKQTLE